MEEKIFYETTDTMLASFLLCKDHKLIRIDRSEQQFRFIFENKMFIEDDVKCFWNNEMIGVQDFIMSFKNAKSMIRSNSI